MKHRLPTVGNRQSAPRAEHREQERSRALSQDWATRPTERPVLEQRVVAVAHVNQVAASTKLAQELCEALVREGSLVAALVTVDNRALAGDSEAVFARLMETGVRQAKLLRKPENDPRAVLQQAIAELANGVDWVVAWGTVLPQLLQPYFTIVVTGHRRDLTSADPLVLQAQLEVTSPGPELATLLARKLTGKSD